MTTTDSPTPAQSPSFPELRELLEKATKGPWEHMRGRGLVRAIRGDVAVPIFEPLEPYGDPLLADAPTVRVGKEVVFRAKSQGARETAALAQQHYNAALVVAMHRAVPHLLEAEARALSAEQEVERLKGILTQVMPLAEIGFYLTDGCSYSGGDGYSQPYEFSIAWEWQQSKPGEAGWGSLLDDTAAYLATFTEDGEPEPDLPVFRARSALKGTGE